MNGKAAPDADRRRWLTLHIGTHKTGSTALQELVWSRRDDLAAAGTYLPVTASKNGAAPHHNLAYECLDMPKFNPDGGTLRELAIELAPIDLPNVLISSETFCGKPDHVPRLDRIQALCRETDRRLRVVVVLREQLAYLNSLYAFNVSRFSFATGFDDYVRRVQDHPRFRFEDVISGWAGIADEVRAYGFGPGVVEQVVGDLGLLVDRAPQANTGIGPKTVEALRLLIPDYLARQGKAAAKLRGAAFDRLFADLREMTDKAGWNAQSFWGFAPEQARAIAEGFRAGNERVAARYGVTLGTPPVDRPRVVFDPDVADDATLREFRDVFDRMKERVAQFLVEQQARAGSGRGRKRADARRTGSLV